MEHPTELAASLAEEDSVHALNEGSGIGELGASGDLGLLKEQAGDIARFRVIGLGGEALDQRMLGVELEHGLRLRHVLAGFAQKAGKMRCEIEVRQREARRGIGKACGDANVAD